MKCNKALKRWYNRINKEFFLGVLPNNVCVRWAEPDEENGDVGCTDHATEGRHLYELVLSREKNNNLTIALGTLVHEMVHIATKLQDDHDHQFEQWRIRLANRGIFKKGALRKNLTLF